MTLEAGAASALKKNYFAHPTPRTVSACAVQRHQITTTPFPSPRPHRKRRLTRFLQKPRPLTLFFLVAIPTVPGCKHKHAARQENQGGQARGGANCCRRNCASVCGRQSQCTQDTTDQRGRSEQCACVCERSPSASVASGEDDRGGGGEGGGGDGGGDGIAAACTP